MAEEFSISKLISFRRRYFHSISGEDVLKLGVLCEKHMEDEVPPKIKWASISQCLRKRTKEKNALYDQHYVLSGLAYFHERNAKIEYHGLQFYQYDVVNVE